MHSMNVIDLSPELFHWVKWYYSQLALLCFGNRRILASSGVQQGDPLVQFIDAVNLHDFVHLNLWYLDDGLLYQLFCLFLPLKAPSLDYI